MSADELIQYLSWAIYLLIFAGVVVKLIRRPRRANLDIGLLFSATTLIIVVSGAGRLHLLPGDALGDLLTDLTIALLLSIPYWLVRLVDDFTSVPPWVMWLAGGGLLALAIGSLALPPTLPGWFANLALLYLISFLFYAGIAFVRESRRASGVTRRRMRAAALGSGFLVLEFGVSGLGQAFPALAALWQAGIDLAGLASGICYFIGFAPPGLIRRAWQEPELRAFLSRAAALPRLPDTESILREMEHGAATSVGAPYASIGLWDEAAGVLRFLIDGQTLAFDPAALPISGGAFLRQRPLFSDDIRRLNPANAAIVEARGTRALLAAPVTAGEKRLGVLTVYASRAPIFAEEDLDLIQLLADQAAVILESRALIDEAARVRAREEVTRLKEDFLSAAAHDLKTPLTTLVAQTQLLERRALRQPDAPADLAGIQKLVKEANRLKTLVLELLDAARAEQGRLVGDRQRVDLVAVVEETCTRHNSERHPCRVEAPGPAVGTYDPARILQLTENLVENAVKYSPDGGEICVRVWQEDGWNHFTVADQGIGIPAAELPQVFNRFHRGANVDDRRFSGMGLGLFICQGIVEQHGGRISVSSTPGQGTTFRVALPVGRGADGAQEGGPS